METTIFWVNVRVILGLHGDNGKESGNYYILGIYSGYIGVI